MFAPMRALATGAVVVSMLVLVALSGEPAYAEHETRSAVLQDVGLNVVILALTIAAIVLSLVAFAIIVLRWEQQDEDAADARPPHGGLAGHERSPTGRD